MVEKRPKCSLGRRLVFVSKTIIAIVTIVIKVEVPGSTTGIVIGVGVGVGVVNCRAESRVSFCCCVDQLPVYKYGMSCHWYLKILYFSYC